MAAWITVYLQQAPANLDAETIQKAISPADWWTLGEEFGVQEGAVDAFMAALRWGKDPLQFGLEGRRPVQFHLWTDRERLIEELEELPSSTPLSVRTHLKRVQAILALEMGISQLRTMHEVVAFEVAYWLAETGGGLIRSDDGQWYDHDEHRWQPIED